MTFLPSPSILAAYALTAVLLALTPGPDMTLFLSRTLSGGRSRGFAAMLGATSGLVVHSTLASLGLSALLAASAPAFMALKIFGAAYLVFLAVQAIRHGAALNLKTSAAPAGLFTTYLTGVGINLTNPKVIMFFVTFLPQFVDADDPHASGKLLFLGLSFMAIGTLTGAAIILAADRFVGALKRSPKALRIFDYGFAALMSAFALKLLTTQGR